MVRRHQHLGAQVREWGVDMVKLDFLYQGAQEGLRHDPRVTGTQALRTGLRAFVDQTAGSIGRMLASLKDVDYGPLAEMLIAISWGKMPTPLARASSISFSARSWLYSSMNPGICLTNLPRAGRNSPGIS